MFKRFLLIGLMAIFLTSCFAKREVLDGNVFSSPDPFVVVKVDDSMPFIETFETGSYEYGYLDSNNSVAPQRSQFFYFVDADKDNKVRRFFVVEISWLTGFWWEYADTFNEAWRDALAMGKTKLNRMTYNTASTITDISKWSFAEYIRSKSYYLSNCYSLKVLNTIAPPTDSEMVTLWYGKDCETAIQQFAGAIVDTRQKREMLLKDLDESFRQALTFAD